MLLKDVFSSLFSVCYLVTGEIGRLYASGAINPICPQLIAVKNTVANNVSHGIYFIDLYVSSRAYITIDL